MLDSNFVLMPLQYFINDTRLLYIFVFLCFCQAVTETQQEFPLRTPSRINTFNYKVIDLVH